MFKEGVTLKFTTAKSIFYNKSGTALVLNTYCSSAPYVNMIYPTLSQASSTLVDLRLPQL